MSPRRAALLPLILAAVFALRVPAASAQGTASFDLAHLMTRFAAVKSASAHYVERRYVHFLKGPLVAKGVLIFTAPNRLEKKTLEPAAEDMVIEGDTLTVQREGQTQTLSLSAYPQIGAFIEGIRAAIVDKDRNPIWLPDKIDAVTPAIVERHFKSVGALELKFED